MSALDGIRARLAAATPGPWAHDDEGFMGCGQVFTLDEGVFGANIAAPSGDLYPRSGYSPKDDMVFIAHSPTDMARLLAAVDNVEALASAWESRAKHLMNYSEECPESVRHELYEQGEEMADNARKIRTEITAALEAQP